MPFNNPYNTSSNLDYLQVENKLKESRALYLDITQYNFAARLEREGNGNKESRDTQQKITLTDR